MVQLQAFETRHLIDTESGVAYWMKKSGSNQELFLLEFLDKNNKRIYYLYGKWKDDYISSELKEYVIFGQISYDDFLRLFGKFDLFSSMDVYIYHFEEFKKKYTALPIYNSFHTVNCCDRNINEYVNLASTLNDVILQEQHFESVGRHLKYFRSYKEDYRKSVSGDIPAYPKNLELYIKHLDDQSRLNAINGCSVM